MRVHFGSDSNAQHFQYDVEDSIGIDAFIRGSEVEITVTSLSLDELTRIETLAETYGGQIIEP